MERKQTKLNHGMFVYVPLPPAGCSSQFHLDGMTLFWRQDPFPSSGP